MLKVTQKRDGSVVLKGNIVEVTRRLMQSCTEYQVEARLLPHDSTDCNGPWVADLVADLVVMRKEAR